MRRTSGGGKGSSGEEGPPSHLGREDQTLPYTTIERRLEGSVRNMPKPINHNDGGEEPPTPPEDYALDGREEKRNGSRKFLCKLQEDLLQPTNPPIPTTDDVVSNESFALTAAPTNVCNADPEN